MAQTSIILVFEYTFLYVHTHLVKLSSSLFYATIIW